MYLDDLDSSNGTYVNQGKERVTTVAVPDRTRIVIGKTLMSFRVAVQDPSPPTTAFRESVIVSDLHSLSQRVSDAVRELDEGKAATQSHPSDVLALSNEAKAGIEQVASAYARLAALYDATGFVIAGFENLDQCLSDVLDAALSVLQAERGFVMLRDAATDSLQVKVARDLDLGTPEDRGSMGIAEQVAERGQPVLTTDAGADFSGRHSIIAQNIRSVLCVPLMLDPAGEARTIGVLYLDTRGAAKVFTAEDQELLTAFGQLAAIAIENARLFRQLQEEERLRERMGRSLPRAVVHKLLDAGEEWGPGGDEQFVTVLDSDIRGFTSLSERLTPHETIDLLNYYFGEMTQIVFAHEGTLDKFMGDGLMAIFGAPYQRDDDAARAVQCACEMVRRMSRINVELGKRGLPALRIGIGLNSGVAIAGNVGSERRMDYTVVGDTVNVACRLQKEARPDPESADLGVVLVSASTYDLVKDHAEAVPIGDRKLKGKEAPQKVYRVLLSGRSDAETTARQPALPEDVLA